VLKKELLGVLNGLVEKLVISVWRVCSRSARAFDPCKSGSTNGSESLQRPTKTTIERRWGNCSGRCISSEKDRQKQKMQSASAGKISAAEMKQEKDDMVGFIVARADMVKVFNTQVWAGQTQICRPEVWADGNSVPMVEEEVIGTPAFHTEVCVTGGRTDIAQSGTGSNTTFEKPGEKTS
jgi:hypothetical protein